MRLSVILVFLQLWANAEVCLSQDVCSRLPDVPHAFVSEETTKPDYQGGDVIYFTCEPGYTSSQSSKYVCTGDGWLAVSRGTCYSCSKLPHVPHAVVSEQTKKVNYQGGDVIFFTCEPGYTSSQTPKYVCSTEGWLAVHQGTCYSSSCDAPSVDAGITVKGLPENNDPIVPNHIITFSCDDPEKYLEGSSVLICGEDGQWNNPFPSCADITCEVPVMHHHLSVAGLPAADKTVKTGHKLQFQCHDEYTLDGSEEIECLQTGQWNAPFPTCTEKCIIRDVPQNVQYTPRVRNNRLRKGEKLTFSCRQRGEVVRGKKEIECSAGGQWSDPFPTCGEPSGCERPPTLTDGDTKESLRLQYRHNERVEYICQNYYVMEGQPYKTCNNGEWIGQMRCLKPCTVTEETMSKHNIAFYYRHADKLYSTHGDEVQFRCVGRTRHDGIHSMRSRCVDGVMQLPTCL
ncbi:complement factor H-related protein 1-like [Chaetodon auriga]|uniref:complement factor H-related protein 1-like n=1 Tax=Chaetodon auriga TaxID=39042 RepID=UPI004032EB09